MYMDIALQAIATEARMHQRKHFAPSSQPGHRRSADKARRTSWLWANLSRPTRLVRRSTPHPEPGRPDC
jgi:hypothetical protein